MGQWQNNNNNNNGNGQRKARSGARMHKGEFGVFISAWKATKGGKMTLKARPYKKTKRTKGKNGKEYENWFVTIVNQATGEVINRGGLYAVEAKKLYMPDLNKMVNPQANNGGYWGKHISKNYNN